MDIKKSKIKIYFIPFILAFAFLLLGLLTLKDYGINWDAPLRMIRGQVYLDQMLGTNSPKKSISPIFINPGQFATRFDPLDGEGEHIVTLPDRPLFKKKEGESFYRHSDFEYYFMSKVEGHPPLIDIISAASNRIFFEWLNILDDLESYKIVYVFLSSIGVFVVSRFTHQISKSLGFGEYESALASFIAGISLGLSPIYFSESHFNMKDPIQASFFVGSIWSLWNWIGSGKSKWFVSLMIFAIAALGIKWNIIFFPFIVLPWLVLIRKSEEFKKWFDLKKLSILTILFFFILFLFLILIWPPAWKDPLSLLNVFKFYHSLGTNNSVSIQPDGFISPFGINIYPAFLILIRFQELVIFLSLIGIFFLVKKRREDKLKTYILLLLFLIVPILRISIPPMWFYNGIRQIMEVFPAIAILSGLGAGFIFKIVQPRIKNYYRKGVIFAFCIFIFLILFIPIFRLHPDENLYFNGLVGGLNGAAEKKVIVTKIKLGFGNQYKSAAEWMNKNVEKNANIAFLSGPAFALSPLYLREDISLSPFHFSGFDQKGEYLLLRYHTSKRHVFAGEYAEVFLNPVYEVKTKDTPMLSIYKNSPEYLKKEFLGEKSISNPRVFWLKKDKSLYMKIDLGVERRVKKLILSEVPPSCQTSSHVQFLDEIIIFDSGITFLPQERKVIGKDQLEIYFLADKTRFINVYPRTYLSCFLRGKVSEVIYIP